MDNISGNLISNVHVSICRYFHRQLYKMLHINQGLLTGENFPWGNFGISGELKIVRVPELAMNGGRDNLIPSSDC